MAVAETDPVPFHLGPGWFAAWRAAYVRPDMEACTIGGLPMLIERARLGPLSYRRCRAQTNVHSGSFDLPSGVKAPDGLFDMLAGRNDLCVIDYVPESSPLLVAARAWTQGCVDIRPHALAPMVDCRGTYADWLGRRSKRIRQRWPARMNKLVGAMGMRFAIHDGSTGLPALLDECFAVEASGWKGAAGSAIRDDPRDLAFYTDLAHAAAAAGVLRIVTLSLDERIVAFEYGVLGGDRLFVMKVGYDEQYERLSIGHVLAMLNIQDACGDRAIAWYDKMGNGMTPAPYKLRFSDVLDPLYRITLYANGWRGQVLRTEARARNAARALRRRWRGTVDVPA